MKEIRKVAVIGIGGVGMAHVNAAVRGGNEVVALVDTNREVLEKATQRWVNKWGSFEEEVPVNLRCIYSDSIIEFGADTIIIATPPHTHEDLIRKCLELKCERIIVEKPITFGESNIKDERLQLSTEWCNHSKLSEIDDIDLIGMAYKTPSANHPDIKKTWTLSTYLDLMPHLLSILALKYNYLSDLTVHYNKNDAFFATIVAENVTTKPFFESKVIPMFGHRENDDGLMINNVKYEWEENLFDIQINNPNPDNWQRMEYLHNLMIKATK